MTRGEMCEKLAEDYAKRAGSVFSSFKEAYNKYMERLSKRTDDDILQQFSVSTLSIPTRRVKSIMNKNEYIITTRDDDCEDGVCKL
jgi:hypothetical protein